jgi:hypothetical protein
MKHGVTAFFWVFFLYAGSGSAQLPLARYAMSTQLNDECVSGVSLMLFDTASRQDTLNRMILAELLRFRNDDKMVTLEDLYKGSQFIGSERPFMYTINGTSPLHRGDLYSFIACPYNACDKSVNSNYETMVVNIDARTKKILSLEDVIEPSKRDSFEGFCLMVANRYHVRNVPSCFISLREPVEVKSSNGATTATDTVTYYRGVYEKFYFRNEQLVVYNKAEHRDYVYKSIELSLPYTMVRWFLKPSVAQRLGLK